MFIAKEIAAKLRLSLSKVYDLMDSGKLAYYQMDGAKRVSEEQLQRYLETCEKRERGDVPVKRQSPRPRLSHIKL